MVKIDEITLFWMWDSKVETIALNELDAIMDEIKEGEIKIKNKQELEEVVFRRIVDVLRRDLEEKFPETLIERYGKFLLETDEGNTTVVDSENVYEIVPSLIRKATNKDPAKYIAKKITKEFVKWFTKQYASKTQKKNS